MIKKLLGGTALFFLASSAFANECEVTVESNDADNNYLKPDDERVIGATDIIGGGEQASTTFSVEGLNKDEEYMFFCSFPGHIGIMKGTVTFSS